MFKFFSQHKAFSLLETLIVVAIISMLATVVIPNFIEMRNQQILQNTILDVYNSLNKAKTNTLGSLSSNQYGVQFESNQVIIFVGTTYVQGAQTNEIVTLNSSARLSSINLAGGGNSLYFNKLSGTPSRDGSVTVAVGNLTKVISIGPTGNLSVN